MRAKLWCFVFLCFLVVSNLYPQTNVQGIINANTTWTVNHSPYIITGSITIRDGATLTIENGVEVHFNSSSYYINVGYSQSSKGTLIANGVLFKGLQSSDSRIYFKNSSASGTITNCIFDNTYLLIENNEINVCSSTFRNCDYPIVLNEGGTAILSNIYLESNNKNFGILFHGNINSDYTLKNYNLPYFIDYLTIKNNSTLTIESGNIIYLTTSSPITIGSSTSSKGTLIATDVLFKGTISSDSKIYFKNQCGEGNFINCTFDNSYLQIEKTTASISNCIFKAVNYPIILEDGGIVNIADVSYDVDVLYPGLCYQGYIEYDLTIKKENSPYHFKDLTIRNNSTLTIEAQTTIYFPSSSGIQLGSSLSSKGNLIANEVNFIGLSSSDGLIQISYNSNSQFRNCFFNNAYINIDNSSPEIKNCRFTKSNYAIITRNNSNPTIINNDFYNNNYAILNNSNISITAKNNFWGDPTGPTHTSNPAGVGQKIQGSVDFIPFSVTPYNGNISFRLIDSVIDFGEVVVGSQAEKNVKLITSTGSIDLFIKKFVLVDSYKFSFSINPPQNIWVTNSETISVKLKFSPKETSNVEGNLLISNNIDGGSPIIIPLKGKGLSKIVTNTTSLSFGKVDLKDSKTLPLIITNRTQQSVTIDSIKITNSNFTYLLGENLNLLSYDESISLLPNNSIRNSKAVASLFYLSPNKSKEILVTFKPTARNVENGIIKIYYSNQVYEVYLSGEGYAAPLSARIVSMDFQNFPNIQLNVSVDTFYQGISTLTQNNFQVYENGVLQTDNFNVIQPGQSGNARLADIIFIMDNSGSMGDEQQAVSNNVIDFVNNLANSGVDFALGLCRYGSSTNSGNPIIENNGELTSNPEYFKNTLWKLNNASGSREPGYYAIKYSASSFTFRPGSQKIFIIITDEDPDQGGATIDEAVSVCLDNNINLYALTNSRLYSKFTPITNVTNGNIFDIYSNFNEILNSISNIISSNYLVQYKSFNSIANNEKREVIVTVNYKSDVSSDTIFYNPASIPKITRTDSTIILHSKAWIEGTALKISAVITDDVEPFVSSAILFYKRTDQNFYSTIQMIKGNNDKYFAHIPSSVVKPPGVDYYITVTDGIVKASDPKTNPSQNPYQIAILPNVAPTINHNIIEASSKNTEIHISAAITDSTNYITEVMLYYRKSGQITYQYVTMTRTTSNTYAAVIPQQFVTGTGIEYYIKATDDFGLSSFHGTVDEPHKISIVALNITAQLDTLQKGPSIKDVNIPKNGTGYCYFTLKANGNDVFSTSKIKATLISSTKNIGVEGIFLKHGVFRLDLPGYLFVDSIMTFTLGNGITVSDTFYNFNSSPYQIKIKRIPTPYERAWTIFASGSAGVSGSAGSIGAGVSASAAKLSVKGEAGGGLEIKIDQEKNLSFNRRLEASLTTEVEVPEVNLSVGSATVSKTSATVKTFFGQQFEFSRLYVDRDKIKMAQAGFMLETMSYAGLALSPGVGAFLKAIIDVINTTAGMNQLFTDGYIGTYSGLGVEGSIGAGFQSQFQGIEFNALNPSLKIAANLKLNSFNTSHPSNENNSAGSTELSLALDFNFSTLDFGLKANDKVKLQGDNFSLFDIGIGSEFSAETKITPSFDFNGLALTFKGGGGLNLFNASRNIYYETEIDIPPDLYPSLLNSGSSITNLFTKNNFIHFGSDIIPQAINAFKSTFNNISKPIEITTSEIRGNGFALNLGLDIDAALGVGIGVSFGIKGSYYDEITFPRKFSKVYLNGENYLIYSNEYSSEMESDNFTSILSDIFSGVLPLIKQSFLNIINTIEKIIVAGKEFIINVVSNAGDAIGTIGGIIEDTGSMIVSTIGSYLPSFYQTDPFMPGKVIKMNRSTTVYHITSNKQYKLYESNLIIISDVICISFKKSGETTLQDTMRSPYIIKMIVRPDSLKKFNLSMEDSSKIKIYHYDKKLLNWVYIGGEFSKDTVTASTNKLGEFALGIELTNISDKEAPQIIDYGPKQGSIIERYPEIYAVVKENKFGSGLDLANSKIIINGKEKEINYDPSTSKIFYQTTKDDILNYATNYVEIIVCDFAGNHTKINFDFRAIITSINNETVTYKYELYQNYPNPFNPYTQIKFSLAEKCNVEINIYDIRGKLVRTLFKGELEAGYHNLEWDSTNNLGYKVSSGVYFYQLKSEKYNVVKKMILLR